MSTVATWPATAENWLDQRGKGAWIAVTILGFIFFWPVGLALLAYLIWSKRMFNNCRGRHGRHMAHSRCHDRMGERMAQRQAFRSSGNTAFDAYKADTLERLEQEQEEFESFLERLRAAKDQSEFDDFMDERAKTAKADREEPKDTGGKNTGKNAGKDAGDNLTVET